MATPNHVATEAEKWDEFYLTMRAVYENMQKVSLSSLLKRYTMHAYGW